MQSHPFTADNRLVQCLQSSICPYHVHPAAQTSPIRNSQFRGVSGLSGTCFPQNCPFPFWDRHPHITHYSSSQAHSSSQTALSSFQPFLYEFPMLSVQCVVSGEETPKTVPSPWDFVTLPEEDRAIARGNMYKKIWQRSHCFRRYARRQTDRYTHTYVLITILCPTPMGKK